MTPYQKLLLDPRWQKKRLEILSRDNFTCQSCLDDTKTLHVHHRVYSKQKANPWDYQDKVLITLCEDCHRLVSESMQDAIIELGEALKLAGFFPSDLRRLSRSFRESALEDPHVVSAAISASINNPEAHQRLIDSYFEWLSVEHRKITENG